MRAVVAWSQRDPDGVEAELRIAGYLGKFWLAHGGSSEARQWLDHAVARCGRKRTAAWALAQTWMAQIASLSGRARAGARLPRKPSMWRTAGDSSVLFLCIIHLAFATSLMGDPQAARSLFAEAAALARETDDRSPTGAGSVRTGTDLRRRASQEAAAAGEVGNAARNW